jgi:hypothetical protein
LICSIFFPVACYFPTTREKFYRKKEKPKAKLSKQNFVLQDSKFLFSCVISNPTTMARRRSSYYRRRSTKRKYSRRRSTKRKYSRRRSYSRNRRAPVRRKSYARHYSRPCSPGFKRNSNGRCVGSKYNVPSYVNPTFNYGISNAKTGKTLSFGSKYKSLADAFKARENKSAPYSLSKTTTALPSMKKNSQGHWDYAGGRRKSRH